MNQGSTTTSGVGTEDPKREVLDLLNRIDRKNKEIAVCSILIVVLLIGVVGVALNAIL